MSIALGAGLTVISASSAAASPASWACAYVAERLPRALAVYGDDAVPAGETRAARKRLSLPETILTRASAQRPDPSPEGLGAPASETGD